MPGTKNRSGGHRTKRKPVPDINAKPLRRPSDLSEQAAKHWTRLARQLPKYILQETDSCEFRILCNLLARADHFEQKLKDDPEDLKSDVQYRMTAKEIHRMSASFGLNPSDRAALAVRLADDKPDDQDVLTEFLEAGKRN